MSAGTNSSSGGPDFICFGLQKAGTRWLYDQMSSCDRVWMTPVKELNYFAGNIHKPTNVKNIEAFYALTTEEQHKRPEDERFFSLYREVNPAARDESWYRSLFVSKQKRLSGDISPILRDCNGRPDPTGLRHMPDGEVHFPASPSRRPVLVGSLHAPEKRQAISE